MLSCFKKDILCRLFEDHADLLNLFSKFKDVNLKQDQMESNELADHAKNVMTTLDESIQSLDDMDYFLKYLHGVGAEHTKISQFNRDLFWVNSNS